MPGEVLESIPEEEASSTAQRKRTSDLSESTRQSSSKKQKTSTNDGESPTLKRLIKELKTPSSASTDTQPPIAPGSLTELYEAIITAEDKNKDTIRVVITKYYLFGKELEKIFNGFKSSYRERKAQRLLVKEVTKQLPGDLTKNAIEKRIERGRKVYDLFSDIGYDKIQLIKSFSASQIYKLSWDDIDAIEADGL